MFLQIRYLEGQKRRKEIYDINPPLKVLVSSSRILCSKNATFSETGSTVCYAWFIWEKGFDGKTTLEWFN